MKLIIKKANDATGEERDGSYAARAQTGYEKDGSPQYRYFHSMEEYKTYLANKNKSDSDDKKPEVDDSGEKLKRKLTKEQRASSNKINKPKSSKNLLVSKKESTKKSTRLMVL